MAIQVASLTFTIRNGQYLNFWWNDANTGLPVRNATVTATLYYGRSKSNPDATPGTADPNFTSIPLQYLGDDASYPGAAGVLAGHYQGLIPASFDPTGNQPPSPLGGGYACVVDANAVGYQPQHLEIPSTVKVRDS